MPIYVSRIARLESLEERALLSHAPFSESVLWNASHGSFLEEREILSCSPLTNDADVASPINLSEIDRLVGSFSASNAQGERGFEVALNDGTALLNKSRRKIDELRISTMARSASEIARDYEIGHGTTPLTTVEPVLPPSPYVNVYNSDSVAVDSSGVLPIDAVATFVLRGNGSTIAETGQRPLYGIDANYSSGYSGKALSLSHNTFVAYEQPGGINNTASGALDDLRISSRARSEAEIKGISENSVPPRGNGEWIVTTIQDDATVSGSLRHALTNASNGDVIHFESSLNGQTIKLKGSALLVGKSVTIDASSLTDGITIDADGKSRVFTVHSSVGTSTVELKGLTITGGLTTGAEDDKGGAGVYNQGENLR